MEVCGGGRAEGVVRRGTRTGGRAEGDAHSKRRIRHPQQPQVRVPGRQGRDPCIDSSIRQTQRTAVRGRTDSEQA